MQLKPMQINEAGLDLIKRFEGLRLQAYQDVAGIWTIGYGHIKDVTAGMKISAEKAEEFLRDDLEDVERALAKLIRVDINPNEFSALASLVFNIGQGAFKNSTTLRLLNKDERIPAADAIELWNKATVNGKKQVVAGLAARRAAEKGLFLTPTQEIDALIAEAPKRVPNGKNGDTVEAGERGPASRETPVESSRVSRDNLVTSRTMQGGLATLLTGGVTAGPEIVQQVQTAIAQTKGDIETATAHISETAAKVQAAVPQAQDMLEKAGQVVPPLKGLAHNEKVVDWVAWATAHQHEIVGAIVVVASAYIIFARIDDWFKGKR